jgi:exopolysaccharide biosynthesis polyprenyl glycosylphosphotransferase
VHTQPVAGLPLIHVERPTYSGPTRVVKSAFDMVGAVLLLILFSPFMLAIAAVVKLDSPGPVFFRQERVGVDGTRFRMAKFRTMRVDAEAMLDELRRAQETDAGNEVLFKIKNDPRITRVGRFLRRYSLDEIPQLFNVVSGEMSLVGPRPPLAAEVAQYQNEVHRRLLVRPGMTGLWQVSGRSDLSWEETVRLDLSYVENWSITGDLMILFKTAKAVLSSSGAY